MARRGSRAPAGRGGIDTATAWWAAPPSPRLLRASACPARGAETVTVAASSLPLLLESAAGRRLLVGAEPPASRRLAKAGSGSGGDAAAASHSCLAMRALASSARADGAIYDVNGWAAGSGARTAAAPAPAAAVAAAGLTVAPGVGGVALAADGGVRMDCSRSVSRLCATRLRADADTYGEIKGGVAGAAGGGVAATTRGRRAPPPPGVAAAMRGAAVAAR